MPDFEEKSSSEACAPLYQRFDSIENGDLIWNALQSKLGGKIVVAPDSPQIRKLVSLVRLTRICL